MVIHLYHGRTDLNEDMEGWKQTDGSLSTMQYGRQVAKYTWEYREVDKVYNTDEEAINDFENWHEDTINILDYSKKEIKSAVETYGYTFNDSYMLEQSGQVFSLEDSIQLIAECIFELNH